MKFIFTEDSGSVHERARYMRGGLLRNYHKVKTINEPICDINADIWLHGLSHLPGIQISEKTIERMEQFTGKIVFFQNDDNCDFAVEKIPLNLANRACQFLRNVWPSDEAAINPLLRDKTGLLNPLLKPNVSLPGRELKNRPIPISFFGAPTSGPNYTRIDALRMLKKAKIPLLGGLFQCSNPEVPQAPEDLLIQPLSLKKHMETIENSRITLALHGFNPLTFRFFEGFSRRSLVIAQSLSCIRFADCGLADGIHYVATTLDLSDLVDKISYYSSHPDEAQQIANAGHEHFKKYFCFQGVNLPQPLYNNIIATWKNIEVKPGSITPFSIAIKIALPMIHSL